MTKGRVSCGSYGTGLQAKTVTWMFEVRKRDFSEQAVAVSEQVLF
jgi:hypothetical protein